jgi:hypothetical protein
MLPTDLADHGYRVQCRRRNASASSAFPCRAFHRVRCGDIHFFEAQPLTVIDAERMRLTSARPIRVLHVRTTREQKLQTELQTATTVLVLSLAIYLKSLVGAAGLEPATR